MDRTVLGLAPEDGDRTGRARAHLAGLDGRGMLGLAQVLAGRGLAVTGSTSASVSGPRLGHGHGHPARPEVRAHRGHSPRSAPRSARFLVYDPEVPPSHPDRLSATLGGVEQLSSAEILDRILRRGVGVATTGGRRAGLAAAMIGWTLTHAGLDPTVLLGTPSPQLGGWGRLGSGPHVVVGAGDDPIGAEIVLALDEADPPGRSARLRRWAEAAPPGGYVLGFADATDRLDGDRGGSTATVERFSLEPGHDWWGADVREERGRYRFRAFHRGRFAVEVRLQVPGRHHVLGALAAVAICGRVDLDARAIKEGLEEFGGVSRGFESRGSYRGVTLVDDEAPEPRAVAEALAVAREVFGRRRLRAAYRPSPGMDGSWPAPSEFSAADSVWIVDEEGPTAGAIAGGLADALTRAGVGPRANRASGLDEAIRELDRHLEPGDVLVTLGAGGVGTIADEFLRRLSRDRRG